MAGNAEKSLDSYFIINHLQVFPEVLQNPDRRNRDALYARKAFPKLL
jgi:hypothetical protein